MKKNLVLEITTAALLLTFWLQGISYAGGMTPREADPAFLSAPSATSEQMSEVSGRAKWNTIYKLVKLNIKIYGNLGWQYGRWEALRKYGVDIGPYPGVKKVTEEWFKKRFK